MPRQSFVIATASIVLLLVSYRWPPTGTLHLILYSGRLTPNKSSEAPKKARALHMHFVWHMSIERLLGN